MMKPLQNLDHIAPNDVIRFQFQHLTEDVHVTAKVVMCNWLDDMHGVKKLAVWCEKLLPERRIDTWGKDQNRLVSFVNHDGIEIDASILTERLKAKRAALLDDIAQVQQDMAKYLYL